MNLTDVGGVPSDIAFVRTDGGLRLAALVPTRSEAVLIDPVTSLTTGSPCPPATSLSLVTDRSAAARGAPACDVALLWNGGGARATGVAFWELGQTGGRPYRSIETVGVTEAVAQVLDVPTPNATLKVLQTRGGDAFYILTCPTGPRPRSRSPVRTWRSASHPWAIRSGPTSPTG